MGRAAFRDDLDWIGSQAWARYVVPRATVTAYHLVQTKLAAPSRPLLTPSILTRISLVFLFLTGYDAESPNQPSFKEGPGGLPQGSAQVRR